MPPKSRINFEPGEPCLGLGLDNIVSPWSLNNNHHRETNNAMSMFEGLKKRMRNKSGANSTQPDSDVGECDDE